MKSAISDAIAFLRSNDIKSILSRIRERRVPVIIQLGVYGMCGGLATVFFLGIIIALSKTIIPTYEGMSVTTHPTTLFGREMLWLADNTPGQSQIIPTGKKGDDIRAANLLINNTIGFLVANVVAYVTNILLVFKGGRHHPVLEFFYFTLISGIAFAISQMAGPWLISRFGVATNVAMLTNVLASMLINFVCRKFFVFKA